MGKSKLTNIRDNLLTVETTATTSRLIWMAVLNRSSLYYYGRVGKMSVWGVNIMIYYNNSLCSHSIKLPIIHIPPS